MGKGRLEAESVACCGVLKGERFGVEGLAGEKVKKVSDEAFAFGEIKSSY